mmetsp:Transcript_24086/g.44585  ORF Transcript_24086/g.44585 Transcript_24086/m.44585 type:complete len:219 (-) Transcript_24086:175-831(-)
MQCRIIKFWVMGQQNQSCARVQTNFLHRLVRPIIQNGFARKPFLRAKGCARINDDGIKSCNPRHRNQSLRNVHRAHDHQTQGGIVNGDKAAVFLHSGSVHTKPILKPFVGQRAATGFSVRHVSNRFSRGCRSNQFTKHILRQNRANRFNQDLDYAATSQTDCKSVSVAHPKFKQGTFTRVDGIHGLHHDRAFHATAGNRPFDLSVTGDNHLRPNTPWR